MTMGQWIEQRFVLTEALIELEAITHPAIREA